MTKTCKGLVSLNFEIKNIWHVKEDEHNYHCARFVHNLLRTLEFPLLERIGLKFDFIGKDIKSFLNLLSDEKKFPNLK